MFTNSPHSSQSLSFKKCNKSFTIIDTYLRRDYSLQSFFPRKSPPLQCWKNPIYQYSNPIKSSSSGSQSKSEFSSCKNHVCFQSCTEHWSERKELVGTERVQFSLLPGSCLLAQLHWPHALRLKVLHGQELTRVEIVQKFRVVREA